MYYFYDATYILVLIGAVISIIASMNVKSTFSRYSRNNYRTNMTGAQAASDNRCQDRKSERKSNRPLLA